MILNQTLINNKWISVENIPDTPLLQTFILNSSLLYLLLYNLLANSEMRLEGISLLDPTTKLPLSGSLEYPSLEWQPSFCRKVKMRGSKQGNYCSLAANENIL